MRQVILKVLNRLVAMVSKKPLTNDLNALYQKLQELPEPQNSRLLPEEQLAYSAVRASLSGCRRMIEGDRLPQAYYLKLLLEEAIDAAGMDVVALMNADKLLEQTILKGELPTEFQIRHWGVVLLIENLGRALLEEGGPNYLSMGVGTPLNKDYPEFELVMTRTDGKTQAQIISDLKAEVEQLKGRIGAGLEVNSEI